jgi:hypothetical protein
MSYGNVGNRIRINHGDDAQLTPRQRRKLENKLAKAKAARKGRRQGRRNEKSPDGTADPESNPAAMAQTTRDKAPGIKYRLKKEPK